MFKAEAGLKQEQNMSSQFSTISPQQLHELIRHRRYTPVVDVRNAAEYRAGQTRYRM